MVRDVEFGEWAVTVINLPGQLASDANLSGVRAVPFHFGWIT